MDLSKIKEVLGHAAIQAADTAVNSVNQTVNTAVQKPGMRETIMDEGGRRQANEMDRPSNIPKTKNFVISPVEPYTGLIAPKLRQETAKEADKFIDAIDTLYATTPDTHARDKELERIFNYYDYTVPNELLRDIVNELGNAEGLVQRGEAFPLSPMEEWKRQREWLRKLLQDPYGTGGGLV